MEILQEFIREERQVIFAVMLFLFIFGVYRLYHYEMRRKDREKHNDHNS